MTDIKKEGEGGFGDSGGTAFTSTDAGIFTPTYSDRSTRKKNAKRKRTGIDRLAEFIVDDSPKRKMAKSEETGAVTNLIEWVTLKMRDTEDKYEEFSNTDNTPQDEELNTEEEDSSNEVVDVPSEPNTQIVKDNDATPNTEEQLEAETDDTQNISKVKKDVSSVLSSGVKYDALQQGGAKDKSAEKEIEEPYAEGTEVVEEASTDKIIKLLKLLDKH